MFYLQLIISVVFILWGLEKSGRVFIHPELISSWSWLFFVIVGGIIGARACYYEHKGEILLGIVLLFFAGVYLWNMQYYFGEPTITKSDILRSFGIPLTVLIFFGVVFSVFFRYFYPARNLSKKKNEKENLGKDILQPKSSKILSVESSDAKKKDFKNPWVRLILLAFSAGLALLVGNLSGVEEPAGRTKIIISVLILGCVATGLISENTLTKISSWIK